MIYCLTPVLILYVKVTFLLWSLWMCYVLSALYRIGFQKQELTHYDFTQGHYFQGFSLRVYGQPYNYRV